MHLTILGCSKCLKEFPRTIRDGKRIIKADYSGFNKSTWPLRTDHIHVQHAREIKRAATPTKRNELEKKYGARWSTLFELTYFRPIRYHSCDAMHLLYLGLAKRFTKWLFNTGVLTQEDAKDIQKLINKTKVPSSVGRIPRKIGSQFSSLTADQWKKLGTCIFKFCSA